jgi:hypothetical protein
MKLVRVNKMGLVQVQKDNTNSLNTKYLCFVFTNIVVDGEERL